MMIYVNDVGYYNAISVMQNLETKGIASHFDQRDYFLHILPQTYDQLLQAERIIFNICDATPKRYTSLDLALKLKQYDLQIPESKHQKN